MPIAVRTSALRRLASASEFRVVANDVASHARQERAHAVEIAQRLQAVAAVSGLQRQAHDGLVDARAQRLVELAADPHENAAADHVEQAERGEQAGGQDHQADEGRDAAARQHAVVDFQHEEGAGELQDVAHAAHQADRDESATAGRQRFRKLGALVRFTNRLPHRRPSASEICPTEINEADIYYVTRTRSLVRALTIKTCFPDAGPSERDCPSPMAAD
jgi:hypothetical protein